MNDKPINCFKCGGDGHFARNCPQNQQPQQGQQGNVCFNCGKGGHFARQCNEPRAEKPQRNNDRDYNRGYQGDREERGGRGGFGNRGEGDRQCYNCKGYGHLARDCKKEGDRAKKDTCFSCGQEGHFSRDCPQGDRKLKNECYNCHEVGHLARDCKNNK